MRKKFLVTTLLVLSGVMILNGCSKEKNEVAVKEKQNQEITFMIPDWGVPPQNMLAEFENETGIKVNVETVSWDDMRNKIAIAASGNKAAADVFEVDWSWIGEFEKAKWLEPIELSQEDINDIPSISTFIVNDQVLAIPYANDFRIGYYNKMIYEQAGLDEPQTWNDVMTDMEVLKEKNILKYPYTFPLNANEATTTSFIWLTYLRDGKVFNKDGTLNKENALTTLNFVNDMLKKELINPANLTLNGLDSYRQILSKDAAFMIGPTSFIARAVDPAQSKAIGEIEVILPPGKDGKTTQTMALTEAVGVFSI